MHKVLKRQLKKVFGKDFESHNCYKDKKFLDFIKKVSHFYEDSDKDRKLFEHSLQISSEEMQKKNEILAKEIKDLQQVKEQMGELKGLKSAMLNILEDLQGDRSRMEIQLLETEKFKLAVENSETGTVITTPDEKIIYVNKAVEKLTGYSKKELIGKTPRMLKSGKTSDKVYKELSNAMKNGHPFYTEEMFNQKKSGEDYQASLSVYPVVKDGKTQFFVGAQTDITERKELDKSKTEFISIASHQLRTPLSSLRWYLEMLEDESMGSLNEQQKEIVSQCSESNRMMIKLVGELLSISRLELGTFELDIQKIDLGEVVKSVLAESQVLIKEKRQDVSFEILTENTEIMADEVHCRQTILNFISNAVKYTPEEGKIKIRLKDADGKILFEVKDNGFGIPEKEKEKIFTKFFRAQNAQKSQIDGTGLGLYIVKQIIEKMGGSVGFNSEEGKGTTFYFKIPQAKKT